MQGVARGALSLLVIVSACGAESKPPVAAIVDTMDMALSLKGGSAVFVLAKADDKAGEPVVTFDHACASGHRVSTRRDSVFLSADKTARYVFHTEEYVDGVMQSPVPDLVSTGTWAIAPPSNMPFYGLGTSLELHLTYANGRPLSPTYLRQFSTSSLGSVNSIGGSCPGSASDARDATFTYTRR